MGISCIAGDKTNNYIISYYIDIISDIIRHVNMSRKKPNTLIITFLCMRKKEM